MIFSGIPNLLTILVKTMLAISVAPKVNLMGSRQTPFVNVSTITSMPLYPVFVFGRGPIKSRLYASNLSDGGGIGFSVPKGFWVDVFALWQTSHVSTNFFTSLANFS